MTTVVLVTKNVAQLTFSQAKLDDSFFCSKRKQ